MLDFEKKETDDGTEVKKTVINDSDGDGHESVTEYIEKKNLERNESEPQQTEEKVKEKNEDEEKVKEVVQTVARAVPHFTSFALGGLAGSTLAPLIKDLRDKKKILDKLSGNN